MAEIIRLPPLPTIRELLKLYNLRALKHLSQNFLLQPKAVDKLVRAAGGIRDCEVCEVGPGPGSITRSILACNPKKVLVIEKDQRFEPILSALQHASHNKLKVVYADILDYNLSKSFDESLKKNWEDEPPDIHIIGNLPFSIADVLIFRWLEDISLRRNAWSYGRVRMTLTFQEEVARRMVSPILTKTRSGISVMCQNWCKVTYKQTIFGSAFLPKPEVNAGVVHFEPLVKPITDLSFKTMEKIVRAVFNTRQKYCERSIANLFPKEFQREYSKELIRLAGLEAKMRSFQIDNEEFSKLCYAYEQICERDPRLHNYNYRGPRRTREESWKSEVMESKLEDDELDYELPEGCEK